MNTELKRLKAQWVKKLRELLRQRQDIDKQIVGLQQMLRGAAALSEDPVPSEFTLDPIPLPPGFEDIRSLGLTDAVGLLLEKTGIEMSPKQIRNRLEAFEYPLTQSNKMAAIHQVLRRLVEKERVGVGENDKGKKVYRWISDLEQALGVRLTEAGVPRIVDTMIESFRGKSKTHYRGKSKWER